MSAFTSDSDIKNNTNAMLFHVAIDEVAGTARRADLLTRGNDIDNHNNRVVRFVDLMSHRNMLVMLAVLACGLATVNGLKCHMCGQYNEGVGSITPCLNYSDQYAHLYLKECSKKSEKYCVKYASELSIVRDCATECVEKEIWETQTYCCNTDGCNGSTNLQISKPLLLMPLLYCIYKSLVFALNERH